MSSETTSLMGGETTSLISAPFRMPSDGGSRCQKWPFQGEVAAEALDAAKEKKVKFFCQKLWESAKYLLLLYRSLKSGGIMDRDSIDEIYDDLISLLLQKRLRAAMEQVAELLKDCGRWDLQNRLEQIQTSYRYMLEYFVQGVEDVERPTLYKKLLREMWEIVAELHLALLDKASISYYHALRNNRKGIPAGRGLDYWLETLESIRDDLAVCSLIPNDVAHLKQVQKHHEETNHYLFLTIWRNNRWTPEEAQQATAFLRSELLLVNDLALMVSAVTLSLMTCFDLPKFLWLTDAYSHHQELIRQRALVGIVFILISHPEQMGLYTEVEQRLECLNRQPDFALAVQRIYLQMLQCQETENVDKKMREEIIPGMMKGAERMRGKAYGTEEFCLDEYNYNPDWEQEADRTGFYDKLEEMGQLQKKGADIYLSTFSQLKSGAFFHNPCNWLLPFDRYHLSLLDLFPPQSDGKPSMVSLMLDSPFFCDSDKYSLCQILNRISPEQQEAMMGQMSGIGSLEDLDDEQLAGLRTQTLQPDMLSNHYLQDLYRLFFLSPWKSDFRNLYLEVLDLYAIPVFEFMWKPELLRPVAEFLFANNHHDEALSIYIMISDQGGVDADLFQKMGYCYQERKEYSNAIQAYRKADVLKPDHLWTLRHMAACYRKLHYYGKALQLYKQVEKAEPENLTLLYTIAICLIEEGKYEDALKYLYKLIYLDEHSLKGYRALGWCLFVTRKYQSSLIYYNKVLDKEPTANDYMNAGHASWAQGNLLQAVDFYQKSIAAHGDKKKFLDAFARDVHQLEGHGITSDDILLLEDYL